MDKITYQQYVNSLYLSNLEQREKRFAANTELTHALLGLAGETGEVVDYIKKGLAYGRDISPEIVLEEAGDLIHYLTRVLSLMDLTLDQAMESNVAKLNKRYPEGYSDKAAIDRIDK